MKRTIILSLILLSALFISCSKKSVQTTESGKLKVGLVFDVGGRGDKSFNDAAYRGLEKAKNELGVDFEYIEPGPGADREAALRQFATRPDIKLIFGIGFIFTDEITKMAQEFPNKDFACVDYTYDQTKTIPPNLLALEFKEDEGCFLVGAIAGLTTKTQAVGFVGGMESPLIKKFEKSYEAGVKYVNPECKVFISYAGVTGDAFKNPGKGKELALGQYSQGADIIFHASGVTGLGVFEAARETKKLAIGVDSDQYNEAPGFILTSMIKSVDVAVFDCIRQEKDGKFNGGKAETFGLNSKGVDYIYNDKNNNLISEGTRKRAEEIRELIIAGKIATFLK
ncbi:MAG: BMP family ABC transporter substrate-binding protein [Ignavibacteriae bacterium]|nr:MAG: BMP family ABC transporter substrate-binding protein [Ignavibacteriota bacterium]